MTSSSPESGGAPPGTATGAGRGPSDSTTDHPRVGTRVEEALAALALALICIITFANVLVRYFTSASFAFTEELSVFLLVVLTFVGTAAAFARNLHIRMDFVVRKLPQAGQSGAEVLVTFCALALFGTLAFLGWRLFVDDWQYGTTSPGIGIPQWIYTAWLPLLSAVIGLRILGIAVRLIRRARR